MNNKDQSAALYYFSIDKFEEAKKICSKIISKNPKNLYILKLLTEINIKLGFYEEASKSNQDAINLSNNDSELFFKRSIILQRLNKQKEAIENCNKAININKNYAEAYNLKAILLENIHKDNEALENWDKAIKIKSDYFEAYFNKANYYQFNNNFELSLENYNKAIKINKNYSPALHNRARLYLSSKKYEVALLDYDHLIKLNPKLARFRVGKANILNFLGQKKSALKFLDEAIKIRPKFHDAFFLKGIILWELKYFEEAIFNVEKAYSFKNKINYLNSLIIFKTSLCEWKNINKLKKELVDKIVSYEKNENPVITLSVMDSPEIERKAAEKLNDLFNFKKKLLNLKRNTNKKIKIGYFSADFRDHATSHLIARIFELHDKNKFEIIAFSFWPENEKDKNQNRIKKACSKFIDVSKKSDIAIAELSRELNIDIAIDLMGYANNNKFNIFLYGCAPIQVNYLGYPGTMGLDVMDYIIADKFLITQENEKHYSENIVYMPNSYQPNDDQKEISKKEINRKNENLPDDKFVFCCFNKTYKITPEIFSLWMEILNEKKDTVLWLFANDEITKKNIRSEAEKRNINPERIIFAKQKNHQEHLARHKLADLFIDTYPYTGHTTTSDSLWTGLPVITMFGNSFASRVSGSLLKALDINELITSSKNEYKNLIINLHDDSLKLKKIKDKINNNISNKPLFNSKLYTEHLENSYLKMFENFNKNIKENISF